MRLAKQTHVSPLNSPIRVSYLQPNCGFVTEWPKISKICCISPALNRRRLFISSEGALYVILPYDYPQQRTHFLNTHRSLITT